MQEEILESRLRKGNKPKYTPEEKKERALITRKKYNQRKRDENKKRKIAEILRSQGIEVVETRSEPRVRLTPEQIKANRAKAQREHYDKNREKILAQKKEYKRLTQKSLTQQLAELKEKKTENKPEELKTVSKTEEQVEVSNCVRLTDQPIVKENVCQSNESKMQEIEREMRETENKLMQQKAELLKLKVMSEKSKSIDHMMCISGVEKVNKKMDITQLNMKYEVLNDKMTDVSKQYDKLKREMNV